MRFRLPRDAPILVSIIVLLSPYENVRRFREDNNVLIDTSSRKENLRNAIGRALTSLIHGNDLLAI
jgi:hypothetical protein